MQSRAANHGPQSAPGMVLGNLLFELAHEAFVPREPELDALKEALAATSAHAVAIYLSGAPGTGKSALLHMFLKQAGTGPAPAAAHLLDLQRIGAEPAIVLESLASSLQCAARPEEIAERINACGRAGAVLAVDGYDLLGEHEQWFRNSILLHLGPGVLAVLTGQTQPTRLWGEDRSWRRFVRTVEVDDLEWEQARSLLESHGMQEETAQREAFAVSSGRPEHLVRIAEAYAADAEHLPKAGADGRMGHMFRQRLSSFFIEHMLHPGSRREAWRAGLDGAPVDRILAAAAMLPRVHRQLLERLVGVEAVAAEWSHVMSLPGLHRSKGGYVLEAAFASRLREAVMRERPWKSIAWRQEAVRYYVGAAADRAKVDELGDAWGQIAQISAESPWHELLNPAGERLGQWTFAFGVPEKEDLEAILACCASVCAPGDRSEALDVRRMLEERPGDFLLARDAQGQVVGYLVCAAAAACDAARAVDGNAQGCLALVHAGAKDPESGVERALLRAALQSAASFSCVEASGDGFWASRLAPSWHAVLPLLGFTVGAVDGRPAARLDLTEGGFAGWLQRVAACGMHPAAPEHPLEATEEALQRMRDPAALDASRAAAFVRAAYGPWDAAHVRSWLMDALVSVETNGTGRNILLHYYRDVLGSHDEVALKLDLARTTYFRLRAQAIADLAKALFECA